MTKPHAWTREPYKSKLAVIKALHVSFKTVSAVGYALTAKQKDAKDHLSCL